MPPPGPVLVYAPNHIGDTVMAVAAVRQLARTVGRDLWIVAHPLVAPIWRRLHSKDRVLVACKGLGGTWGLARALRRHRIRRAYVLAGSTRAALIPWLAGIPQRVGYDQDLKRYFLTELPPLPGEGKNHKSLDYYALIHGADSLAPLAGKKPVSQMRLASKLMIDFAGHGDAKTPIGSYRIALIPGAARGPAKRWPVGHFTELASMILGASPLAQIDVLGAKDDQPLGAAIRAGNDDHAERITDRTGKTSIEDWLDALAGSELIICNDSGGMHVADGFGRPLIALFGTTDPAKTGPSSPESVAMQKSHFASEEVAKESKESQKALAAISPEEVFRQVVKMLDWLKLS